MRAKQLGAGGGEIRRSVRSKTSASLGRPPKTATRRPVDHHEHEMSPAAAARAPSAFPPGRSRAHATTPPPHPLQSSRPLSLIPRPHHIPRSHSPQTGSNEAKEQSSRRRTPLLNSADHPLRPSKKSARPIPIQSRNN